jgi:hypothetical protein
VSGRVCEFKEATRDSVKALPPGESLTKGKWGLLDFGCPYHHHQGDCQRCELMTPENCQRVEEVKDKLFKHGLVQIFEYPR